MSGILDIVAEKITALQQAIDGWLDKLPSSFDPAVNILKSPVELPFTADFPFRIRVLTAIFGIILITIILISLIATFGLFHPSKTTLMKWENKKVSKKYDKKQRKQNIHELRKIKKEKIKEKKSSSSVNKKHVILTEENITENEIKKDEEKTAEENTETAEIPEEITEEKEEKENHKEDFIKEQQEETGDNLTVNDDITLKDTVTEGTMKKDNIEDNSKSDILASMSKLSPKEFKKAKKEQLKREKKEKQEQAKRDKIEKKKQLLKEKQEKKKQALKEKELKKKGSKKEDAQAVQALNEVPAVTPKKKTDNISEAFVPTQNRKKNTFDYLDDLIEDAPKITLDKSDNSAIVKTNIIDTETVEEAPAQDVGEEISLDTGKPSIEVNQTELKADVNENVEDDLKETIIYTENDAKKISSVDVIETEKEEIQISDDSQNDVKPKINTETKEIIEDIKQEENTEVKEEIKQENIEVIKEEPVKEIEEEIVEVKEDDIPMDDDLFSFLSGEEIPEKPKVQEIKEEVKEEPVKEEKPVEEIKPQKVVAKNVSIEEDVTESSDIKIQQPVTVQVESMANNSVSPNGQYEVIEKDGKYRFILTDDSDKPIYTSREYKNLTTCINGSQTFKKNVATGDFIVNKDKFGLCRFILTSKSSSLVKYDGELFRTEEECIKNIEDVKKFSQIASIIMRT